MRHNSHLQAWCPPCTHSLQWPWTWHKCDALHILLSSGHYTPLHPSSPMGVHAHMHTLVLQHCHFRENAHWSCHFTYHIAVQPYPHPPKLAQHHIHACNAHGIMTHTSKWAQCPMVTHKDSTCELNSKNNLWNNKYWHKSEWHLITKLHEAHTYDVLHPICVFIHPQT